MPLFAPKLPISEEERLWMDNAFQRLDKLVGRRRMVQAKVVLPDAEHFPDPFKQSSASAEALFQRVCLYMGVQRSAIDLEIFPDETEELRSILPYWRANSSGCAGFYTHENTDGASEASDKRMLVALRSSQLKDPLALVATVAHELGHVILLGGGLIDPDTADHEPLTDLLTVYLGLGIFTANSAARFIQYQDEQRQGWSMQRLGYLPEEAFGYALARFAVERNEDKPEWARYLSTNVRSYYKRSRAWMEKENPLRMKPIG